MNAEAHFRRGALQGARWFHDEVERLASEGQSSEQIADRLFTLVEALQDWVGGTVETPAGAPWEWSSADLDYFIAARLDGRRPEYILNRTSWSRAKPLEEGFFWYREERGQNAEKVEVFQLRGRLHAVLPGHAEPVPISVAEGEWSGPICPPE